MEDVRKRSTHAVTPKSDEHDSKNAPLPRRAEGKRRGKTIAMRFNESEAYFRSNCSKKSRKRSSAHTAELLIHGNFHLLHQNATAFVLPLRAWRPRPYRLVASFRLLFSTKQPRRAQAIPPCVRGDYINCNIIFAFNFILPFAFHAHFASKRGESWHDVAKKNFSSLSLSGFSSAPSFHSSHSARITKYLK